MVELVMEKDHMEKLYASKNPLVRYVHVDRLKKITNLIPKKNVKLLDAGWGEGQLLVMISKKFNQFNPKLYGTDITKIAAYDLLIFSPMIYFISIV